MPCCPVVAMVASGGHASASDQTAYASGGNTSASMDRRENAALSCYPVTVDSAIGDAGRCGRNGRMKLGVTLEYSYAISDTCFKKFHIPKHVGIDHESGDYHQNMADPIAAFAAALRSAKMLAESLEYRVGFGWPVVWDTTCCLVFYPGANSEVLFDRNSSAEVILSIKEATEKFSSINKGAGVFCMGNYFHLGTAPAIFSDANYIVKVHPRILSRASRGNTLASPVFTSAYTPATLERAQQQAGDDESDAGSEAAGRYLTPAQTRREEALRLTAAKALKIFNTCRMKTEAAAVEVMATVTNERMKAKVNRWIWDIGAGIDIVPAKDVANMSHLITKTATPLPITTANGESIVDKEILLKLTASKRP